MLFLQRRITAGTGIPTPPVISFNPIGMVGVGAGDSPTEPYLSVSGRTGMDFSTQRVNLNLPTPLTAPTSSSGKTVGWNSKVRDHPERRGKKPASLLFCLGILTIKGTEKKCLRPTMNCKMKSANCKLKIGGMCTWKDTFGPPAQLSLARCAMPLAI